MLIENRHHFAALLALARLPKQELGTALGSYRTLQSSDGLSKIRAKLNEFTFDSET